MSLRYILESDIQGISFEDVFDDLSDADAAYIKNVNTAEDSVNDLLQTLASYDGVDDALSAERKQIISDLFAYIRDTDSSSAKEISSYDDGYFILDASDGEICLTAGSTVLKITFSEHFSGGMFSSRSFYVMTDPAGINGSEDDSFFMDMKLSAFESDASDEDLFSSDDDMMSAMI